MNDEASACAACGGHHGRLIYDDVFDDRYGFVGRFGLWQCDICHTVRLTSPPPEGYIPALYETHYPRNPVQTLAASHGARNDAGGSTLWQWLLAGESVGIDRVYPGMRILDVGCGNGQFLVEARARGACVAGIEADPSIRAVGERHRLAVHVGTLFDYPGRGPFDLVRISHVLEHLPRPGEALSRIRPLLAPDGRVLVVLPNVASLHRRLFGRRWLHWHPPYHLHHFSASSLRMLATRFGYAVEEECYRSPTAWIAYQLQLALRPTREGVPHPSLQPRAPQPGALRAQRKRRLARAAGFLGAGVLQRAADAARIGDCLVAVLRARP